MWRQLSREERRCFEVQNAAIPAIARMRLTGCPFVPEIHRETIRRWEIEHAEKRAEFKAITGEEPPARDKVGALARGAPAGRGDRLDAAHRATARSRPARIC